MSVSWRLSSCCSDDKLALTGNREGVRFHGNRQHTTIFPRESTLPEKPQTQGPTQCQVYQGVSQLSGDDSKTSASLRAKCWRMPVVRCMPRLLVSESSIYTGIKGLVVHQSGRLWAHGDGGMAEDTRGTRLCSFPLPPHRLWCTRSTRWCPYPCSAARQELPCRCRS